MCSDRSKSTGGLLDTLRKFVLLPLRALVPVAVAAALAGGARRLGGGPGNPPCADADTMGERLGVGLRRLSLRALGTGDLGNNEGDAGVPSPKRSTHRAAGE